MKINTIIFSCDRAMQLDAVLSSFFLHCKDAICANLFVYYKTTSKQHERLYAQLIDKYSSVTFVEERNFHQDIVHIAVADLYEQKKVWLLRFIEKITSIYNYPKSEKIISRFVRYVTLRIINFLIGNMMNEKYDDAHILFLVDDNIFVRDFLIMEFVSLLQSNPDVLGFSLRLGKNIQYSYTRDRALTMPQFFQVSDEILKYDWTKSDGEFGYPFDISSSLFRAKDVLPLLFRLLYANPNELEAKLASRNGEFCEETPYLLCGKSSYSFCNPINLVQTYTSNRFGGNSAYSTKKLAAYFSQGYRIQINEYSGFIPESCHQEIELKFTRN